MKLHRNFEAIRNLKCRRHGALRLTGRVRNRGDLYFFFLKDVESVGFGIEIDIFQDAWTICWTYFREKAELLKDIFCLRSFRHFRKMIKVRSFRGTEKCGTCCPAAEWRMNQDEPAKIGESPEHHKLITKHQKTTKRGRFPLKHPGFSHQTFLCITPWIDRNWSATGASSPTFSQRNQHKPRYQEPDPPSSDPQHAYFEQAVGLGWKFLGKIRKIHKHHLVKIIH